MKLTLTKKLLQILVIISCSLLVLSISAAADNNLPPLIVGTSSDNPPNEFIEDGEIVGFDISLIKAVAAEMNREIIIKDFEFSTLIPAVKSGKIDLAISDISPSPERAKKIGFSRVYYRQPLVIIYPPEKTLPDVNPLSGLNVGVQFGTTYEQALMRHQQQRHNFNVAARPSLVTLISDLKNGRIDVLITTMAHANRTLKALPGFNYEEFDLPDAKLVEAAIVTKKNSPLLPEINRAIASLESQGIIDQLSGQWFDPEATAKRSDFIDKIWFIISGVRITLLYSLVSAVIGIVIGTGMALTHVSNYRILQKIASGYVSIFRGTPLLVQLSIIHYGVPYLLGIKITPLLSGILTFGLNSSAYVSETIKAGINSVDKGQYEAARALGIPYRICMKDIILPQAFRKVLPSLVNEVIDLMKESSLLAIIGEVEMMRRAQIIAAENYDLFTPYLIVACCYYLLVMLLSKAAKLLENRLAYDRR